MFLSHLSVLNFKNYQSAEFQFCPRINCLAGKNGSGKTNILDAIYYLSFTKSYFNPIDSQNIRHSENFFMIQGKLEREEIHMELYCGMKRNQKKIFKLNNNEYERLSEHIGTMPLVIITPSDIQLIHEGSIMRRKFMDGIISQIDRNYLENLLNYSRFLEQRNAQLKAFSTGTPFNYSLLELWDGKLLELNSFIYAKRKEFLEEFIPVFQKHYLDISGDSENVTIEYESQLNTEDFKHEFSEALQRDLALQRTTAGIHKDELSFLQDGMPVKKFASQGQQKTLVFSLKLAQYHFLKSKIGFDPVLLLDDIYEKLDEHRAASLVKKIGENSYGQVFITDTHLDRLKSVMKNVEADCKFFKIESGEIVNFE